MLIDFEELKEQALASRKKRSRVILTPGFDMVICLHRSSYVRMHRHPKYEAYHVMEGILSVALEKDSMVLDEKDPVAIIHAGTWHEPRAVGREFVIYREFYAGPFEKAADVEYAPWAKEEAA